MAEERTEEPSPRKLRRARARGEVALSPLASGAAATIAAGAALIAVAPLALSRWRALIALLWQPGFVLAPDAALEAASSAIVTVIAPPVAAAVVAGALASFLQVGPLWAGEAIAFDGARLDPLARLRATFAPNALIARLAALPVLALFVVIAADLAIEGARGLAGRSDLDPTQILDAGARLLAVFAQRAGLVLAAAAVIAVIHRRWRYRIEQRMSRREVEREQRESEGEPQARRRRNDRLRASALGPRIEEAVRAAALIVRGDDAVVVLGWDGERPSVLLVARGVQAREVLRKARLAPVFDPALALALARRRADGALPRPWLLRLAGHLARTRGSRGLAA